MAFNGNATHEPRGSFEEDDELDAGQALRPNNMEFSDEYESKPVSLKKKMSRMVSSSSSPWFLQPASLLLLLLALLSCNVILYLQNRQLRLSLNDNGFTGVHAGKKTWDQFRTYTKYSDVNHTVSDPEWAKFTTNGFVAIPHKEAANYGLPVAEDFPDDSSKGVYVLSGFHEVHCVIYLRETINDLLAGKKIDDDEVRMIHVNHCYDALRQTIQCRADDTPLYIPYRSKLTGDGQFRQCRSWKALTKWAQEHTACWPTGHCADLGQTRPV